MSGILTGRLKLSGKIARQYVGRVSGILTGRLKLSGKIARQYVGRVSGILMGRLKVRSYFDHRRTESLEAGRSGSGKHATEADTVSKCGERMNINYSISGRNRNRKGRIR